MPELYQCVARYERDRTLSLAFVECRTMTTDLAQRLLRHGWRVVEEGGELVLYGNGQPAAFTSEAALEAWLSRVERAERKSAQPEQLELWERAA